MKEIMNTEEMKAKAEAMLGRLNDDYKRISGEVLVAENALQRKRYDLSAISGAIQAIQHLLSLESQKKETAEQATPA